MGLAEKVTNRNTRAASRLLSWIENGDPRARKELKEIFRNATGSYIIGITGPPGSGKSTLADGLISHYRSKKLRVGILAVVCRSTPLMSTSSSAAWRAVNGPGA